MILRLDHPQSPERNREGKQSQNFHCYCELLSKSLQEHVFEVPRGRLNPITALLRKC